MSRTIIPIYTRIRLGEAPPEWVFWQTQTYQARLAALEEIRREFHQWKYHAEPRFQRVYSIVKR